MKRIFEDAFNLLCGEKLGKGIHRTVYECKIRPDLVVKVEHEENYRFFSNVFEQKFWDDNQNYKKVADWLAPCEYLSPDGRILLQRRVKIVTEVDKLPDKMPSFLTDFKPSNFGFLNDKLVCVDYALVIDNPNIRLKKVFSWE
ncbi:MAG TPA: hypothetical protein VD794_12945 [Flavisolibacter sp.]|nr:hypothetical protein [Flavisolibacter sp.]